jgi:uncharacterized membrane protein YfcA
MNNLQPKHMTTELVLTALLIGLAAGMLSGLVGVGGGIIMVPALVFFMHYTQHQAQGTSLAVLTLPVVIIITNAGKWEHRSISKWLDCSPAVSWSVDFSEVRLRFLFRRIR